MHSSQHVYRSALFSSLTLLMMEVVAPQLARAQVHQTGPVFMPACDLATLNKEYIGRLNRLRRQLNPSAPLVRFDPNLFIGSVLHVAKMEAKDSLVHSFSMKYFMELIGAKKSVQTQDAGRIAQFALSQFEGSERHCQIQECAKYMFVAIASSQNYYIVRLSETPLAADRGEKDALKKLGVKELEGEQETKPAHRLVYRAF